MKPIFSLLLLASGSLFLTSSMAAHKNLNHHPSHSSSTTGHYFSDTAITTKVKSSLLTEKDIPSTAISVTTNEGKVTLSGTVESKQIEQKAVNLAKHTKGVKTVEDKLIINKASANFPPR